MDLHKWSLDPTTKFPINEKTSITNVPPLMRMIVALINPYYENELDAPAAINLRLAMLNEPRVYSQPYLDQLVEDIIVATKADPLLINEKASDGSTPFMMVIEHMRYRRLDRLITIFCDLGANINDSNAKLMTPLHMACNRKMFHALYVVKLLINNGADVNAQDKYGFTPLMYAIRHSLMGINIIGLILDKQPNLELQDKYGRTPLIYASKYRNYHVVRLLLQYGANVNATDAAGDSALTIAAINTKSHGEEAVKILIQAGANVNHVNNRNQSVLFLAATHTKTLSTEYTVKILLKAGATPNKGIPIIPAVTYFIGKKSTVNTLKLLLNGGADVNAQCKCCGYTGLFYAVKNRDAKAVKILLDANINVDILTNRGLNIFNMMLDLKTKPNIGVMVIEHKKSVDRGCIIKWKLYTDHLIKIPEQAGKIKFSVDNFGYELTEISFKIKTGEFCYQSMDKPHLVEYFGATSEADFIGKVKDYFLGY